MSITQIYWLTRIADAGVLFIVIPSAIALIVFVISLISLFVDFIDKTGNDIGGSLGYSLLSKTQISFCKRAAVISGIVLGLLTVIGVFIPSKNDVRLMIFKQMTMQDGVVIGVLDKPAK